MLAPDVGEAIGNARIGRIFGGEGGESLLDGHPIAYPLGSGDTGEELVTVAIARVLEEGDRGFVGGEIADDGEQRLDRIIEAIVGGGGAGVLVGRFVRREGGHDLGETLLGVAVVAEVREEVAGGDEVTAFECVDGGRVGIGALGVGDPNTTAAESEPNGEDDDG